MKRKRFTEEQIIGILSEAEQAGNIREVCWLNNITEQTFYRKPLCPPKSGRAGLVFRRH